MSVWSDDELKIFPPERCCCVGTLGAHGDNVAASDVHGDFRVPDIVASHIGSLSFDFLKGVKVIECVLWHVEGHVRRVGRRDGTHQECITMEELQVNGKSVGIIRVLPHQRSQHRSSSRALPVKIRVHVVEEFISRGNGFASSLRNNRPPVKLLVYGALLRVVAVEWIPGSEHRPARAESGVGVVVEAADVGAYHWDLEHGDELDHLNNLEAVVIFSGAVVSEPVPEEECQFWKREDGYV